MAERNFGVDKLNVLGTGTPSIDAGDNDLSIVANRVGFSSDISIIGELKSDLKIGNGFSLVGTQKTITNVNDLSQLSDSNNWNLTLGASGTIPNPSSGYCVPGQSGFISITQNATGGYILGWGPYWEFTEGEAPSLSVGPNDVNVIGYYVRTTTSIVADALTNIG